MRPQSNDYDGNDPNDEGAAEEKSSKERFEFDFEGISELKKGIMNNNNHKPPAVPHQPATAAVNSIHWDVEEGTLYFNDHLIWLLHGWCTYTENAHIMCSSTFILCKFMQYPPPFQLFT